MLIAIAVRLPKKNFTASSSRAAQMRATSGMTDASDRPNFVLFGLREQQDALIEIAPR